MSWSSSEPSVWATSACYNILKYVRYFKYTLVKETIAAEPKRGTMTSAHNTPKRDRLEARIPHVLKLRLERAAALEGVGVSEFVTSHLLEATDKVIHAHEMMMLTDADTARFVEAMLNPPALGQALLNAAERWRRLSGWQSMTVPDYRFERLGRQHNRAAFSCGVEALDRYLQQRALPDMAKNVAQVFVLVHQATSQVAGFCTLSAFSLWASDVPDDVARRLPRYPVIPATILGRLAIDQRSRGQGLGAVLLLNALRRARDASELVALVAVIVDARSDQARKFYEHYQFRAFVSDPNRLFLPLGVIQDL